ncbi:FISUMP domain-containing protein [Paraflavitalea pollutisoli]|uniref:FISUMP domain-containing protein n=1 Tax=Paraflavitalea pollutisoli TaxID=3034143 RepID=UPI0023EBC101|nr:FISUMP domain-containing protein [Paraflavitalea sp. H1-2-19X]
MESAASPSCWAIVAMTFVSMLSNDRAHGQPAVAVAPVARDTVVVDQQGHHYAVKTMQDGLQWMTVNLQTVLPGSFCYDDAAAQCARYGRLYTWKEAGAGCALLGSDWRLPTAAEWQRLTLLQGRFSGDTMAARRLAFQQLMTGGAAGFEAVLGGGRAPEGGYARGEAHGFYWTSTSLDSSMAYYGNFAKGSKALYLQTDGEKEEALSVRCVRGK